MMLAIKKEDLKESCIEKGVNRNVDDATAGVWCDNNLVLFYLYDYETVKMRLAPTVVYKSKNERILERLK